MLLSSSGDQTMNRFFERWLLLVDPASRVSLKLTFYFVKRSSRFRAPQPAERDHSKVLGRTSIKRLFDV
jgi:hypothetical protein